MHKDELVGQLRSHARTIANFTRDRATQRAAIVYNHQTHPLLLAEELQVHDMTTDNTRRDAIDTARGLVSTYRTANVLRVAPDCRPAGAAEASWIGAICSQATAYSPTELSKQITDAAARNDVALVSALMPLMRSKASYAKPFVAAPEAAEALVVGQQCLDDIPEMRESRAAADFADICEVEIRALDIVCSSNQPGEGLAQHVAFNALPTIMPSIA